MVKKALLNQALALGSLDIDAKGSLHVLDGDDDLDARYELTIGEIKSSSFGPFIRKAGHQLAVRLAVVATVLKAIEPTAKGTLRGIISIRSGTVDIGKAASIVSEVQQYERKAVAFPTGFNFILSLERIN